MSRNRNTKESLSQFMNRLIAQQRKNGQHRTMQHYRATLNSYVRFRANKDILLADIDAEEMQSYEAYLKNIAKVCNNTISFYLRILRATYNKAVAKGIAVQRNPFSRVYTGIAKTRKRAIRTASVSQIKRLHSIGQLTPKQELARDTFLMCFYLRGISFVDLAHLRKTDLKDGYLHYTRSKTGGRLTVRWEKEMQAIVDKYRLQTASSPYLFPFLVSSCMAGNRNRGKEENVEGSRSKSGNRNRRREENVEGSRRELLDTRREELRLYHNAETRIAYHLKKLGAKLGIQGNLTLYVARHTWATAARDNHVDISVISEALGHHSVLTTQIYLRSIENAAVDDANAQIISSL